MQFIGFWEYNSEDTGKWAEKFKQMTAEREKGNENTPKLIFGPCHFAGESKGFGIYETDDPGKLWNLAKFFWPELIFEFVPIIDNKKVAELYGKTNV